MDEQLSLDWTRPAKPAEPAKPPEAPKLPERVILTVSQLTGQIRDLLEGNFADVWVQGEISNYKPASSGHFYFSLKDQSAQLRSVMFKSSARLLKFQLKDGLSVIARGRISVYEPRGEYQIILEYMEPAGYGALQLAFEQLKAKLAGEGLFDPARKKRLPLLPQRIGLITSPRGAVIADMLRILRRRFENLQLLMFPVKVQGEGSADEIVRALRYFNLPPERQVRGVMDVIILARGGGSIEDLWAFNEEKVARAIAASSIPVISAVGHETDVTIADFVADLRAPTPSAAAELVVQRKDQLVERIDNLQRSLRERASYRLLNLRHRLAELSRARAFESVERVVRQRMQRTDELAHRLAEALRRGVVGRERSLEAMEARLGRLNVARRLQTERGRTDQALAAMLHAIRRELDRCLSRVDSLRSQLGHLSPLNVLQRGYALVYGPGDRLLRDAGEVSIGDDIDVRLARGRLSANVKNTESEEISRKGPT